MQRKLNPEQSLKDIPKKQKQSPVKPLRHFVGRDKIRDESMAQAYWSGHYTLTQVGEHFGVSYATVSRAVKQAEGRRQNVKRKA
ncbi:MAG: helix-turn-helix domain-containing protein [Nitrospirales bacterium]